MLAPETSRALFDEQASTVVIAGASGYLEEAAQAAADFVAAHPGRIIEPGLEHTESRVEIAYEDALRGIRSAIPAERTRRQFAQAFYEHLMDPEAGPPATASFLMLEALGNSFRGEVEIPSVNMDGVSGVPAPQTRAMVWPDHSTDSCQGGRTHQTQATHRSHFGSDQPHVGENRFRDIEEKLEIKTAEPAEFRRVIYKLLRQAASLENQIHATNSPDNQLLLIRRENRIKELVLTQGGRRLFVGQQDSGCYIYREVEITESGQAETRELRIKEAGSDLLGWVDNSSGLHGLGAEQIVGATNAVLNNVRAELIRRATSGVDA